MSNASTKDKVEGDLHRAKGTVKETVGHAVGNEKMEAEGKAENFDGKVQKKVGEIKAVVGK